jgi:Protein of unknown function (DUF3617)
MIESVLPSLVVLVVMGDGTPKAVRCRVYGQPAALQVYIRADAGRRQKVNKGIGFGFGMGVLFCCASALAAGDDESWEISSKMDMPGMAMPASKHTSCLPKGGAYKPDSGPKDKNCQMTDVKVSGNTTSWKMQCGGKEPMTGSGDMTRTADTMNGTFKMNMMAQGQSMQMTQVMSGRRVGNCDAAAEKKKMDDKVAAIIGDSCKTQVDMAVKTGGYEPRMPEPFSKKELCLSSKPELCEKARAFVTGYDQYIVYAKSKGWVVAECGVDLESKRPGLCKAAVPEKKFPFIKQYCPAEAKAFRDEYARNCQGFGRGYTADAAHPHAKLCSSLRYWASGSAQAGQASASDDTSQDRAEPAAQPSGSRQPAAKDAVKKDAAAAPAATVLDGVSKLKGLFGR